mmetsp:Transcript_103226/g.301078  ORF Transcript_103226/g.301078 Transcript_103226/m.301078 type:complete len:291 (-) Transcript_103226:349-1221(-)
MERGVRDGLPLPLGEDVEVLGKHAVTLRLVEAVALQSLLALWAGLDALQDVLRPLEEALLARGHGLGREEALCGEAVAAELVDHLLRHVPLRRETAGDQREAYHLGVLVEELRCAQAQRVAEVHAADERRGSRLDAVRRRHLDDALGDLVQRPALLQIDLQRVEGYAPLAAAVDVLCGDEAAGGLDAAVWKAGVHQHTPRNPLWWQQLGQEHGEEAEAGAQVHDVARRRSRRQCVHPSAHAADHGGRFVQLLEDARGLVCRSLEDLHHALPDLERKALVPAVEDVQHIFD